MVLFSKAGKSMGRGVQSTHRDLLAWFNAAQDYRLARFGLDGKIQIYPEKNNEFFHQLVVAVGPGVFDQQPWVRESKESILSRFKDKNPVSPFVQKVLEVDRESQRSFHKDREAVYHDYNIGGAPHYFLYQMDRLDRETGYFLTVPVSTLVQEFLRSTDCHQILQSNGFEESTSISMGQSYLRYELESPLMQRSLLLHVKKEKAFESLNQLQNRFLFFLCIRIVLTIAGLIPLNVQLRLKDWNKNRREKGLFELKNGIGLSHGVVHLHVIGNEIKKHLVASSTALTRAEELEALSKKGMYSKIILDDPLVDLLDQSPALHEVDTGTETILEWKQEI